VSLKKISAAPSWLSLTDDRSAFVFLPERAEIVQRIFYLAIGGMGSYAIANYLDEQKVPTFTQSPNWDHTTIDYMLRNRATYGEYQPKSFAGGNKKGIPSGPPISNYYPAVVDKATFDAAQIARQQNLAPFRSSRSPFSPFSLTQPCSTAWAERRGLRYATLCRKSRLSL